ncbi:MAG TPA: hypothetical protein VMJ90_08030 [Anaerolineales bacterium]|nr:hypothetical protein [Anaerolineales bacterium]
MNFIVPDHLQVLNEGKIERDRVFILKEEVLKSKSAFHSLLTGLGSWMITKGKKLHTRYSAKTQPRSIAFVQDTSKMFRA